MGKNDRDSIVFRNRLDSVRDAINMLLDKVIIDTDTYVSFLVRILEVRAMEDLDELVSEVTQICKERGK